MTHPAPTHPAPSGPNRAAVDPAPALGTTPRPSPPPGPTGPGGSTGPGRDTTGQGRHFTDARPQTIRAFIANVDPTGGPDACWPWRGSIDPEGYGQFSRSSRAHRAAYELMFRPIPDGLVIDHECHNRDASCVGGKGCLHRRCVNPNHLVARTRGNNVLASQHTAPHHNARKTHCPRGHEYTPENTRHSLNRGGGPRRECRTCIRERHRRRDAKPSAVTS